MSLGLKLSNLPEGTSEHAIRDFFSKITTDIKEIKLKKHSAKVFLEDEEDQTSCLMLDGEELLGTAIEVRALESHSSSSDSEKEKEKEKHKHKAPKAEIPAVHQPENKEEFESIPIFKAEKNLPIIDQAKPETKPAEKHEKSSPSETSKIESENDLKALIQGLALPSRRHLPAEDSFKYISDCQVFSLLLFLSLVFLTFHDLFD